jgi:phosphatidylinositol alpha-1,6-mannosyltransferase
VKQIVGLFPELLGVGGVQEAGRQTAAALEEIAGRHGWRTDFLALNDPAGPQRFAAADREIPIRGFGRAKLQFVLAALGSARKHPHIVIGGHPHMALPAAWMKIVAPRLRIIAMSHGIEIWKPLPWVRRRALLLADLVLAPSRDTARKLAEVQRVPEKKIRRLGWPLNPDFLHLADAASRLPLPPAFPQGRVILAVGRWAASERYKGADELIRALADLRSAVSDLHMVAVGGGDDLPRLQKLASDLGVADYVHFLNGLSREEIAACYAEAEIFALPSTGEGYGLVFLEAMSFAKPVVGAACGGVTDLVQNGVNGLLVPPRDTNQLRRALERLLKDRSLGKELGRRGAEMVQQQHRFDVFAGELERILEECGLDSHL